MEKKKRERAQLLEKLLKFRWKAGPLLHVREQKRPVQKSFGNEAEQERLLLREEHGTRMG